MWSSINFLPTKINNIDDKIGISSYLLLILFNILYFGALFGVVVINTSYINTFKIFVHSILCLFLMYKFNPMQKNIILKDYDAAIIFSSAFFLLLNLGVVEVITRLYINGTENLIKTTIY